MDKYERYTSYRNWLDEQPRTLGEVCGKLNELYNAENESELKELGSEADWYAYNH